MSKITSAMVLAFGIMFSAPTSLAAADWPRHPVQIIVPIDAGTAQDLIARRLSESLSVLWKQPVTVHNKPGAAGIVGTKAIATSAADGYIIGIVGAPFTGSLATKTNLPFARDQLVGVKKIADQNFIIFSGLDVPFNNIPQMLRWAKKNPGKLTYASPGIGSYVHIAMEHLSKTLDLNLTHVPYRSMMQSVPDVIQGRIHLALLAANPVVDSFVDKGAIKIIGSMSDGVTYRNRPIQSLPDFVPGVHAQGYFGIVVPKGTPAEVIEKIQQDIDVVLATQHVHQLMSSLGISPSTIMHISFDDWIDHEIERLRSIIKLTDLSLNH